ncbi:MAG TPA: DUF2254 domain-containing protein [Phycisphaerae bacterium]|nr:DUF2254 domain-containing protein [Phycisphaerae bacterium]
MNWLQWYRVRTYVRSSIWILPVFGLVAAALSGPLVFWTDKWIPSKSTFDPGATRELLETLAASMFTLIVFVSSALLLAIQLASAQLTPRVISLFFKDRVTKLALTIFVFTFAFSLAVAVRISDTVPLFAVRVAAYSCMLSVAFFVYMIDHVGKFLRPSGVLRIVASLGRQVIRDIYPQPFEESEAKTSEPGGAGEATRTIISTKTGVVLAVNVRGLVSLAQRHNCLIELVPQVGEFIALEEPLFRILQGGAELPASDLHNSIAVGSERTIEQDPAFAFRIIVDIASKGLSPAINDPTTAVLAIDQIHRLLRMVGLRHLDEGIVRDAQGCIRLMYRTPDWEDFVYLAVTEIRNFGGTSIQISRRLRAMLDNLIHTLPPQRAPILRQELNRLQRSAERNFPELDDRALAGVSDSQGVGGTRETNSQEV